jgi:hypothetical protein
MNPSRWHWTAWLLIALFAAIPVAALTQDRGNLPPSNLAEALDRLDRSLASSAKEQFKGLPEDEAVTRAHFGLGMGLRNDWGLWQGSALAKYFRDLGIFHPDVGLRFTDR